MEHAKTEERQQILNFDHWWSTYPRWIAAIVIHPRSYFRFQVWFPLSLFFWMTKFLTVIECKKPERHAGRRCQYSAGVEKCDLSCHKRIQICEYDQCPKIKLRMRSLPKLTWPILQTFGAWMKKFTFHLCYNKLLNSYMAQFLVIFCKNRYCTHFNPWKLSPHFGIAENYVNKPMVYGENVVGTTLRTHSYILTLCVHDVVCVCRCEGLLVDNVENVQVVLRKLVHSGLWKNWITKIWNQLLFKGMVEMMEQHRQFILRLLKSLEMMNEKAREFILIFTGGL